MTEHVEIRRYVSKNGRDIFGHWLSALKDARTAAKIVSRIDRLVVGNFGDCKALGGGVFELRIDWGPGYRLYYALIHRTCVLLLCGGDKPANGPIFDVPASISTTIGRGHHETEGQHLA